MKNEKLLMQQNVEKEIFDEDTVRFFIWSVWNFFQQSTGEEAEVGTPYLFDEFEHEDYTGIIGVSGNQKGAVYFTMCRQLLNEVLSTQYPDNFDMDRAEEELETMRMDYAGEMANIVSGNVRNYLGEHFLISVPVVVTAPKTSITIPKRTSGLVFPVNWRGLRCHLVLSLEMRTESNFNNN